LREAAPQGDGDQQPCVAATCGCLLRRDLSTGRAFRVFALSIGRAAFRNAHPRLHAGAHTEPRTEQLSIRVQATHGQHSGPGPFQCRRRFGSGRRHRQTLSERLAAHLQTMSERPAVSCPGPVCVAQFVVLLACVTVCCQNRPGDLRGASRARAWPRRCWSCLDCVCVGGGIDRVRRLVVDT